MRALVVYCHPCEESFNAALRDKVVATLKSAGHEVRLRDLYKEGFQPVMSAEERRGYHDEGDNVVPVKAHVDDILWCEMLIFVYPTWWYGLPAMLKGWLDRVWVPHVTFQMPTADRGMRPNMQHIVRLGVVTTCGASWWLSKLVGEPGRKTLMRGMRALCHPRGKTLYMAHYKMDSSTVESRETYLAKVERRLKSF
ncbi:NAD(P)H-dependent oxidoreductase [Roseibium limicola]|uniref:NAD(P)H-dependent oxidoreductase n=1 Tax=Roseibium limicola TaxID=2816037 RepID=A0A939JAJ8_9HYPH|nr:NAD(P)H-dependent oxidoreductase [Roseibium limicola]MBO0347019.1 NAD(P)H-dependent oxidoreductase [Roseibium limicola]